MQFHSAPAGLRIPVFLTFLLIGVSMLQGVSDGAYAGLVRQARIAMVGLTYLALFSALFLIRDFRVRSRNLVLFGLLLAYLSVAALSLLPHPERVFGAWKLVEFVMYVLWVVVVGILASAQAVRIASIGLKAALFVIVGSVAVSIVAFPALAWNEILSSIPYQLRGGILPINSNDLAAILIIGILFFHLVRPDVPRARFYVLLLLLLLVCTQNRTGLAYFLVFAFFKFRSGKYIALAGILFIALDPEVYTTVQDVVARGNIANLLTGNGRLVIWAGVIEQMDEQLLLGSGFYVGHRFTVIQASWFRLDNVNTFDNTFLDVAFDTGIVGLALFLLFLLAVSVRVYRNRTGRAASGYLVFLRWLTPFFFIDAVMGPTIQTFGLNLAIYAVAYLPALVAAPDLFERRSAGPSPERQYQWAY